MSAQVLEQYIKMHRLRTGLTQDEVAYLLGGRRTGGSRISRYELDRREPPLETALGLEVVLGAPVRDVFRGRYLEVEEVARRRAKVLQQAIKKEPEGPARLVRLATLQRIIGDPELYREDHGQAA